MEETLRLETRTRLNWQYYLVWPDILIGKIQQPKKHFGRRTNLTLILTVVSGEKYALQKIFQTIPLWDTVDRRKKTPSIKGVSTSLHVLSQELKNSYRSFWYLWANDFTIFSLYTWCHLTEWSSSLFADRMGHKRGLDRETGHLQAPPEARQVLQMWKDYSRCEKIIPSVRKNSAANEHSIWREWGQVRKQYEGRLSELSGVRYSLVSRRSKIQKSQEAAP